MLIVSWRLEERDAISFFGILSMCVDICGLNEMNGLHLEEIKAFSIFYLYI